MPSRSVLVAVVLSITVLAAGVGTAAGGDQTVSIEETDGTVLVQTSPCDGYRCALPIDWTPFDLYINGNQVESVGYDGEYEIENSSYTNGSVEIAVAKMSVWGDAGWAYEVVRISPEDQPAEEASNAQSDNRSERGNDPDQEGAPPEVVIEITELDAFGDCMADRHTMLLFSDESEGDHCYAEQFE